MQSEFFFTFFEFHSTPSLKVLVEMPHHIDVVICCFALFTSSHGDLMQKHDSLDQMAQAI